MTRSIKNLVGSLAFMAILFTVACTKDTTDTVSDASIVAVDELVTLSDPPAGPNTPDSIHANSDSTRCWGGRHGRGRGNHPGRIQGDSIGFTDLPAAAQTYLLTLDTSKILRIVKITLSDGTIQYAVRMADHTHIHFDAAGVVITTTTSDHHFTVIAFADLPAAAQTYLNTNTTVANIMGIIKITKPDGTIIYGVRMTDNTRYTFDAAGALIANPTGGRRGHH
jgi:hypothetical protein